MGLAAQIAFPAACPSAVAASNPRGERLAFVEQPCDGDGARAPGQREVI